MSHPEYISAMTAFYKLREKYEDRYIKAKQKIITNTMYSSKEKQQKFRQLKRVCINCKQDGGTIFTANNNVLKAVCGNIENPCRLNIELIKGKYVNSGFLADSLLETINEKKTDLIKIKLDFLFGYISEDQALERFNILKEEIKKKNDFYREIEIFYLDITANSDKKSMIEADKLALYTNIEKIKDLVKVYNVSKNKALIKTIVEQYITDVMPLVKNISDLEYVYKAIEFDQDNNISRLIQKEYTRDEIEYPISQSKIVFNKTL